MTEDARFEDGVERPLRLLAEDSDDVTVVSALLQDSVLPVTEMRFEPEKRRFLALLNRFRWEDAPVAERRRRDFERVQALLVVDSVLKASSMGIDRSDPDVILSVLALDWTAQDDGAGRLTLTFAGDGAIALDVEAIDLRLQDVTRPYRAPSAKKPEHPE